MDAAEEPANFQSELAGAITEEYPFAAETAVVPIAPTATPTTSPTSATAPTPTAPTNATTVPSAVATAEDGGEAVPPEQEDVGAMVNLLMAYRQIISEMDRLLVQASNTAERLGIPDSPPAATQPNRPRTVALPATAGERHIPSTRTGDAARPFTTASAMQRNPPSNRGAENATTTNRPASTAGVGLRFAGPGGGGGSTAIATTPWEPALATTPWEPVGGGMLLQENDSTLTLRQASNPVPVTPPQFQSAVSAGVQTSQDATMGSFLGTGQAADDTADGGWEAGELEASVPQFRSTTVSEHGGWHRRQEDTTTQFRNTTGFLGTNLPSGWAPSTTTGRATSTSSRGVAASSSPASGSSTPARTSATLRISATPTRRPSNAPRSPSNRTTLRQSISANRGGNASSRTPSSASQDNRLLTQADALQLRSGSNWRSAFSFAETGSSNFETPPRQPSRSLTRTGPTRHRQAVFSQAARSTFPGRR